jgi:hypothetical protein
MKWPLEITQLTMAVLRRTTREITPGECARRMAMILDNVYMKGQIAQAEQTLAELKAANEKAREANP